MVHLLLVGKQLMSRHDIKTRFKSRAVIDPYTSHNTEHFCDILDAIQKDPYEEIQEVWLKRLRHI